MKRAAAFRRGTKVFLMPYVKTTDDKWMLHPPVFALESRDRSLGAAMLDILHRSRTGVAHQPDQLRHFRKFLKDSERVELLRYKDKVMLFPTEDRGQTVLDEEGLLWPADQTEMLPELLRGAFEECT